MLQHSHALGGQLTGGLGVWYSLEAGVKLVLPKSLQLLYGVDVSTVRAKNCFANLRFNIGAAPPLLTAIAAEVIQKLQRYFHGITEAPSRHSC